jgi:hypothetical protein
MGRQQSRSGRRQSDRASTREQSHIDDAEPPVYGFNYALMTTPKNGVTDGVLVVCMNYCLADNELGVEGAKEIAKALESNHTLTTLSIEGTDSTAHW